MYYDGLTVLTNRPFIEVADFDANDVDNLLCRHSSGFVSKPLSDSFRILVARRHTLFGFENISANNGWGMAVVGATIVFAGLVILSFTISQVHKILKVWEQRDEYFKSAGKKARTAEPEAVKAPARASHHLPTVKELASIYRPLVDQQQPFTIMQLFEISNKMDLPHPHLSIKYLQEAEILVPQGDGKFIWDNQKAN